MMKYEPIIKGKGFLPNPVSVYGIPDVADSYSFPETMGTVAHSDYWDEQIDRCVNGYYTGGIYITGRYYYYLNFCYIHTLGRGYHHPEFVDLDYEFFLLVDKVKAEKKGIICIKPRRKGLSEKVTNAVIDHGMRFTPAGYSAGLCAGKDVYVETFLQRIKSCNSFRPPEMRLHYDINNFEQFRAAYEIKTENGALVTGSKNNLLARTMDTKPNVFKGELLNDCVFEEAGEFPILKKGLGATKACFSVGRKMVGTPFIYGTGGNINSSMKEFSEIYEEAEYMNLERFEFYADRLVIGFFKGSIDEKGERFEDTPYLNATFAGKEYSPEQVLGCEDVQRSAEVILAEKLLLAKAKDRQSYFDYLTENPMNKRELFLRFTGNDFNTDALNKQRLRIEERPTRGYYKFHLEFIKNKDGSLKIPLEVEKFPCSDDVEEHECVLIRHHPDINHKDLDIGGIDSYDQDKSAKSMSLGSMVVLRRRGNNLKDDEGNSLSHKRIPICLVRMRPERKDVFYENCFKVAVYYNLLHNVLIDASKALIIEYFKKNGGEKYLAPRPLSFESDSSDQQHDYGVLLTSSVKSKPQMIGILQNYVWEEADQCWFPQIIDGLMNYDVLQKDSDWDEVDALGIALIRDVDMKKTPKAREAIDERAKLFELDDWVDVEGVLVPDNIKITPDMDPLTRMIMQKERILYGENENFDFEDF